MQTWDDHGVRQERTNWRDGEISKRHRLWGFNCPAVDLDFLVAEYNMGEPVAVIEYKHHLAQMPNFNHPTYRALKCLADGYSKSPLPFLAVFYWPEIWAFKTYPVNQSATDEFIEGEVLSEYEFVRRLYRLRRLVLTRELAGKLNRFLPAAAA